MTSPSSGPGAHPARRARRLPLRRVLAAVGTTVLLLCGTLPAAASTPTPTPTPEPSVPSVEIAPAANGIVREGGTLDVTIQVHNPSDQELPAGTAMVQLGADPLPSARALDTWLESGAGPTLQTIEYSPVPVVQGDGGVQETLASIPRDALGERAPGVYALSVGYAGHLDRSVVTIAPTTTIEQPIALVVAVTAGPRNVGLLDADELSALTAGGGRLTALLDAVAGTPAILAVDPAILASIRVLGESAPASATEWLTRLDTLPNERFALQFGDADVTAQVQAELPALLTPTGLEYAQVATTDAAPTPTPTATPLPPEPEVDVLDVPRAQPGLYWPAEGRADEAVLAQLLARERPEDAADEPTVALLSDEAATTDAAGVGSVAGARALIYDADTATVLGEAAAAEGIDADAARAALAGRVSLAGSGSAPMIVATDRLDSLTTAGLRGAIDAVRTLPGARATSLTELIAAPSLPVRLTTMDDTPRVDALQDLLADAEKITPFASVLEDPSQLIDRERTAILQLIGAGWTDETTWTEAITMHRAQTADTLDAVKLLPQSDVTLITSATALPAYVQNDLPWPVHLVLTTTPDDLRLDVERTIQVTAEPGVNTRVSIPVRAKVGSGDVTIELGLFSRTYEPIGPVQRAQVNVRADWEGIGVVVLITLVVLLLGVGLLRTILRRRRTRAADTAGEQPGDSIVTAGDDPTSPPENPDPGAATPEEKPRG